MTVAPGRDEADQAQLSQRLNDPVVAAALTSLLDRAELLAVLLEGLDGMVARSEVIGDNLVGSFSELRTTVTSNQALADSGVDLQALVEAATSLAAVLPQATPGMVAAVETGAIDKLFASGVIGADAVDQVAVVAAGLVRGSSAFATQPVQVGGPLSLMRMLKDPDISRALSYFATVAKAIGQELGREGSAAPSTSKI